MNKDRLKNYYTVIIFLLLASSLAAQEICDNEIDDDGDGLIDCFDPDCYGISPCEDFYVGQPSPDCEFTPPPIEMIEVMELYRTDHISYPIDQRSGVYVGDMNCDGIPDLVSRDNNPARIQIYSGDDGSILQSIPTGNSHPFGQLAIADVDRDGKGDIFHVEYTERLARYEFGNPDPVWLTPNNQTNDNSVGTPQIADFNGDGIPEVYVGGRIFDSATGILYSTESVNNGGYAGNSNSDRFPIAYDFFQPGDPKPGGGVFGPEAAGLEYAAGDKIYTFDFTAGIADSGDFALAAMLNDANADTGDGFTSIADINGDGRMDIAVMDGGRVYAWDPYTQMMIGTIFDVPNTGAGGRINIGDFNGDGDVELGFAGRNGYYVLELLPDNSFGVLWQRTGLDDGSQRTGSTLFDFDGDGSSEVVYSEEANLYIFNGADGTELLSIPSEAGTRTEYPLVADVNGDGTAEIIVTSQNGNGPGFSGSGWVTVYTSANQPWVPTRPVWNQHGYNVVNINDDLTVPAVQQDPLHPVLIDDYNNFLVQSPIRTQSGVGNFPAADATIQAVTDPTTGNPILDFSLCPNSIGLDVTIDNAGAAILPANTPIAFYQGDPTQVQAVLIDVVPVGQSVAAGDLATVTILIDVSSYAGTNTLDDVYMVVNDPGFMQSDLPYSLVDDFPATGIAECDYSNNLTSVGTLNCVELCDDGIDNDGDNLTDEPNLFAPTTEGCPGGQLPQLVADVGNGNGVFSIVQPDPTGTIVDANGIVTLGSVTTYPTTVEVVFDDGNCQDTILLTIDDTEPPGIVCPGNQTLPVDASCAAVVPDLTGNVQLNDNCSANGDLTIVQAPASGAPLSLGDNTITMTVTDEAGNSTDCTTTITTIDQIQPQLSCINSVDVIADAQCQGLIPDLSAQTNATDNCTAFGDLTITQIPAAGTLVNSTASNFQQNVQLTIIDESNNQSTCVIAVNVLDQQAPAVICPPAQTIALDQNCNYQLADLRSQVDRSDNCSSGPQIQLTQVPAPGTIINTPGITTVTITAMDQAGNLNSTGCTIDITLEDQNAPTINCPATIMANADPSDCSVTIIDYTNLALVNDNCGGITLSQSPPAGTTFNADNSTVTITATDGAGNTAICDINVQRKDVTPPSITCPADQNESFDGSCQFTLPDYRALASVSDNCPATSLVTQSPAPGTVITANQTITLTATDDAGNTSSCSFQVVLSDDTPPAIECPAAQTLSVNGSCIVALPDYTDNGSTSDNCSSGNGIMISQSPVPGTSFSGNGTTVTVSLTPTDAAGNVGASCSFIVTLEDMQAPSITCPASPQTSFLDDDCEARVPDFRAEVDVSSMCDATGVSLTQTPAPGTMVSGHNTVTQITVTADDGNGNTASCTFDYLVLDNTPPQLGCPANQEVVADANCEIILADYTTQLSTLTDNCDAVAQITLNQVAPAGTVVSGAGTVETITVTATDQAGNASMCMFNVSVVDETPPIVNCPSSISTLVVNADCQASLPDYTMSSAAMDNCSIAGDITLSQTPAPSTILNGDGTTQNVTITATDESNNSAQCSFVVSLEDNMPPMIICPADQQLTVDLACEVAMPDLSGQATVSDNCTADAQILVTQDIAINTSLSGAGTIQSVTLTADDGNGNTANCSVVLTLADQTPPVISCPLDQDLNLDANCSVAIPDYSGQLSATDNCTPSGDLVITQSPAAGTVVSGADAIVAVSFVVDDTNGNTTSCEFDVTLRDVTEPTITCPADQIVSVDMDCTVNIPDFRGSATPADACTPSGMITLSQSPTIGTILTGDNQMQTVTITADDGNGNTASCSFNVITEDASPPMISCPDDLIVAVDNNCAFNVPDYTANATIADNCDATADITITQSPLGTSLTVLNSPEIITLTAEDLAGNTASCTFTVTPADQTNPEIICPVPQVIYYDNSCSVNLPDYTSQGILTDNCSDPVDIMVSQSPLFGSNYVNLEPPIVTVTLTAEDESGNLGSCDFQVQLQDTIRPTVTCPNDTTIALDVDCNGALPDLTPRVVADDNCSGASLTVFQDPNPGTIYSGDGTNVEVTFTIIDSDGNSTQCTAMVTFEDQSPPDPVTCPVNQTLTTDDVCPIAIPDYTGNTTVLDNCRAQSEITLSQLPAPGTTFVGNGTVVNVTVTANDGNGNSADCNFTVTLVDNVPLNLACPGGQIIIASNDDCTGTLLDYSNLASVSNECMSPAAGVTFVQTPAAGTVLPASVLDVPQVVSLEATDLNGNITSCEFQVTLIDTLPPVIICPEDQLRNVEGSCQYFIEDFTGLVNVTDNCSPMSNISLMQSPAINTALIGPDNTQEITINAQDESGNLSECTFIVSIQDTISPAVNCPEPDTLFVNGNCEATIPDYRSELETTDNCTAVGDITIDQLPAPGTIVSGDDTDEIITLTATDESGNTSTCTFNINLQDTISPVILCPGMQVINPDANCDAIIGDYQGLATTEDNCTINAAITISQEPASGTVLNGQGAAREITLTADDGNGNIANCAFSVALVDKVPPSLVCPPDTNIVLDANCEYDLVDFRPLLVTSDNCTATQDIVLTQQPGIGTTLVGHLTMVSAVFTADDTNGNTAQCSVNITLVDETPPTITCPPLQTILADANCDGIIPDYTSLASVDDNCTAINQIRVTQSPAAGTVINGDGTTQEIILRANDGNGNEVSCSFFASLEDEVAPTIVCPNQQIIFTDENCSVDLPDYRDLASVDDNCTDPMAITISQSPLDGTTFTSLGGNIITLMADDGNGNTASCEFLVTVADNTPPELLCPSISVVPGDASCTVTLADYRDSISVSDNCSATSLVQLTQAAPPGTMISGFGTTEDITISAMDGSGNISFCIITVEVTDTIRPSIACPLNTTIESGIDCNFRLPDYTSQGIIDDNCASNLLTVTQSPSADSLLADLNTTVEVRLTVTDANNNQASCSFLVSTASSTPPPPPVTVILEAIPDEAGGTVATFNLEDALDPQALSNTTGIDLDNDSLAGGGPYSITYYESLADAQAEQNAVGPITTYTSEDGGSLIARLEDPATGCFVLSQVLLTVRPQGTSDVDEEIIFCNRKPFILTIEGKAMPGSANSAVSFQWTIVDPGPTGIQPEDLLNPTEENLEIDTEGLNTGVFILEFQFFEDYGNGPVVPSVPVQIEVELTKVGVGTFPWRGN